MSLLCRITLLGTLSVQQDQRRITRFRTQKAGALLAFLTYHPDQTHPREHLLELLWPQLDLPAGRSNLSFVLSSLRHQLEPPGALSGTVLLADRHSVRINPDAATTDVAEFEAGLKAVEEATGEAKRVQQLQETLALYRGPLLPGYYEDWIAPERQRLADRYVSAARQLIRGLAQAGELPRAIDYAQHAASAAPLREALHCDLMRLYVAVGQVPMALQQYGVLERLLQQELGEKPSASTRELAREIHSHEQRVQSHRLPLPEESAATTAEEVDPLSAEAGDLTFARRTLGTTTDPRSSAEEPVAAPSGTITLLLAQWQSLSDAAERGAEVAAQEGSAKATVPEGPAEPTAQGGGANTGRPRPTELGARLRRELGRHGGHAFQRSRQGQGVAFQSVGEALTCAIAVQRNLSAGGIAEEVGAFGLCMALHTGDIEPGAQGFRGRVLEQVRRLLEAGHPRQILCSEAAATLLRRDLQPGERLVDLGLYRLRDVPTPEHIFEVEYSGMAPQACPPLRAEAGYTAHLPLPLTRFFGHEEILAHLQSLLLQPTTRLVNLTGTGGMGKTRLSIEASRRLVEAFGGAVWFVPLADVGADTGLLSALVEVLGLSRTNHVEPLEQVSERLSRQRSLLVLDNFEHLVETDAATVGLLLQRVETLTCLVTSRQRLELGGEHELVMPPLPVPERPGRGKSDEGTEVSSLLSVPSVALFVDRAQAVKPDFQMTSGNVAAIAALCTRLEGIPLAVELAASRAQLLNPAQMLSQLQNRFALLVSRRRDVAPRHRTLRAAIDWSYQLLSPELQGFFARLSVFRGGWRLEAAEAVCSEELALDYLAQLRECSLILTEDSGEQVRYRMLETLREFAFEQISAAEGAALRKRHLEYFLALAEEAEPKLAGAEQTDWLNRLEEEHENLRAGLDWSLKSKDEENPVAHPSSFILHPCVLAGLRLCGALPQFWWTRGYLSEGREWCVRFLERAEGQEQRLKRAKLLNGVGVLASHQGDNASARAYFEEGLTIKRELGDRRGIANSLNNLGIVAHSQGDYASARAYHLESLDIKREIGDRSGISGSLNNLGNVAHSQGDYVSALAYHLESLAIHREIGDRRGVAVALHNLGDVASAQGDYAAALPYFEESLTIRREIGDPWGVAHSLNNLGSLASDQGDYAVAQVCHEESLAIRREIGDRSGMATSLNNLALVACFQGDFCSAQAYHEESLSIRKEIGGRGGIAYSLEGFASLAAKQRRAEQAAALWGAAEALRELIGSPLSPNAREQHDRDVAEVRRTLGEEAFRAAWAKGRTMTLEQATACALDKAV